MEALTTTPVLVILRNGEYAGAVVRMTLDRPEIDDGFVVPTTLTASIGEDNRARLDVWPNSRGSRASSYKVTITHQGRTIESGTAVIPEVPGPVSLHAYLRTPAYKPVPESQIALMESAERAAAAAAAAISASGGTGTALYLEAAQAINGHRFVATNAQGNAYPATIDDVDTAFAAIGLIEDAAQPGDNVRVRTGAERVTFTGWAWKPNRPIFLARQGQLSQDAGNGAFILQIGMAESPTRLRLGIQVPLFNEVLQP